MKEVIIGYLYNKNIIFRKKEVVFKGFILKRFGNFIIYEEVFL